MEKLAEEAEVSGMKEVKEVKEVDDALAASDVSDASDAEGMKDPEDAEEIQVDFDFCSLKDSDYFGVLFLLKQIFGEDAKNLNFLRDLTEKILKTQGTVVKVDESDPYAIMAIINLNQDLKNYFGKSQSILSYLDKCSWLINDRLINMPPQLVPDLLRITLEEEIHSEMEFTLICAKMGRYVESQLDKKSVKKRKMDSIEFYFQPEDEIFQKYALEKLDFEFDQHSMSSDAKRTFQDQGIEPFRRVIILPTKLLKDIQNELSQFLK